MDGLYVHVPFCASKCVYCNFVSGAYDDGIKSAYVDRLVSEIAERRAEVDTLDSVYFGGGTPGQLPVREFERVCDAIRTHCTLAPDTEFTFETNPETVTRDYVRALAANGVNRVSLGLQSDSDDILARIGRRHDYAGFLRAVDTLLAGGIDNLSADLMLGLPAQTREAYAETLGRVRDLPMRHWSVYSLKVEPNTPLAGFSVDDDLCADLYDDTVAALSDYGFFRYETSNFARSGYECRHNLKYWTLTPYLGVGVAAHGDTRGRRSYHTNDLAEYLAGAPVIYEEIGLDERMEEYIMLSLRLERGIDRMNYRTRFGVDFVESHAAAVDRLVRLAALEVTDGFVRIPPSRAYVANGIISELI